MFLFIVYGVGPRHCQNVGCSKSTAKAQLWDTPSVKLTKWVNLCTPFPAQLLPPSSPRLWAPVGLASGSAQSHSNTFPAKVSHLTHTSPPEGQRPHSSHTPLSPPGGQRPHTHLSHFQEGSWPVLPRSHGSRVLRISWEQAVHLRKWAKTLSWLNPPDSSLSPRISLQQQFSLCTSTSWLQTVLRSITKHNPKSSSVLTLGKVTS